MKTLTILAAIMITGCTQSKTSYFCATPLGNFEVPNEELHVIARRSGTDLVITGPGFVDKVPFADCVQHTETK